MSNFYVTLLKGLIYGEGGVVLFTFIIPDNSTQKFIDRILSINFTPLRFNFIEKSAFMEDNNNA